MGESKSNETIAITVEFRCVLIPKEVLGKMLMKNSGGLEMLFSNERKLNLTIPLADESGARSNVAFLVRHLCDTVMKDPRKELFVLDDTVYVYRADFRMLCPAF